MNGFNPSKYYKYYKWVIFRVQLLIYQRVIHLNNHLVNGPFMDASSPMLIGHSCYDPSRSGGATLVAQVMGLASVVIHRMFHHKASLVVEPPTYPSEKYDSE